MTAAERVAAARRWFRAQGYATLEQDGAVAIRTPEHPSTWDANAVLPGPDATPATVAAAFARWFADAPWHVAHVDCLTPPGIEAALALAGFEARTTLIEMVAGDVAAPLPVSRVELAAVDAATWPAFARLVEADHAEGRRTGAIDPAVAAGLLDARRRRLGTCRYWLLLEGGEPIGCGMTAVCPNGVGLIENLFTLPERRGRGLMSGFIVAAARMLEAEGCDAVFLDAHVGDTPKRLYARLGFEPVALTRTWVRQAGALAPRHPGVEPGSRFFGGAVEA